MEAILEGMARAAFVLWYADAMEGAFGNPVDAIPAGMPIQRAGPGEDWMDVAPETPKEAIAWAATFGLKLADANGATLIDLLKRACAADGIEVATEELAREFGHDMAMQGLGTGVSWFDDHAEFLIAIPNSEFYL